MKEVLSDDKEELRGLAGAMQDLVGESLPPWSSCPELQLMLLSGPDEGLPVCGEGRKSMLLFLLSSFLPP